MATIITKAQAAAKVAFYLDLEETVAAGQTVRHGERLLSRADAGWIGQRLEYWQKRYDELAAAGDGVRRRVAFANWKSA